MSWCKVGSLTASVSRALKGFDYPATRKRILSATDGLVIEGWDLGYFLREALSRGRYDNLRQVMTDLEAWAERQG